MIIPATPSIIADPMVPRLYRVRHTRRELADTATLELEPDDGDAIPSFAPGQFNMLYAFGVGEIAISISGDPAQPAPLVHTVRAVGAVSGALHALRPGAMIGVRGPFGTPWPIAAAAGRDVVIVAGGLGAAPLRPVIYSILSRRERYGTVSVLYGARTPRDILYPRLLQRWRAQFDLDVQVTVDGATSAWRGSVGVVPRLIPRATFDPQHVIAMVCGPEVMMRFSAAALLKSGVAAEDIYISMERNMKCALGLCGHCQYGPSFVCKDGPVYNYAHVQSLLLSREV
jgi:NAD(P)H-flavin reductase